jgi:hypothetical protein
MKAPADRIKEIETELHDLEVRRQGLLAEMREIRSAAESPELPLGKGTPNTNEEKIDLFLSLFGGKCQSRVLSHFDLAELLWCLLASGERYRKTPELCLPIIFTISARF